MSGRPSRARPSATRSGSRRYDLGVRVSWWLLSRPDVDNYKTSERRPLPGRSRRSSGAGSRPASSRGRAPPERVAAVGRVRREPRDGTAGARRAARGRADRRPPGPRLVRRRRSAAPVARPPRHDRGAARRRGHRVGAAGARLRFRRRAGAGAQGVGRAAGVGGTARATWPTASRSRGSPSGARSVWARTCRSPTSSARRSTSCSTWRSAARARRSRPTRRPRRMPKRSASRPARPSSCAGAPR